MSFDWLSALSKGAAVFKQFPVSSTLLTLAGLTVIAGFGFLFTQVANGIPVAVSLVQEKFFGNYANFPVSDKKADGQLLSYGEVTITNTSPDKKVALDLFLRITAKDLTKKTKIHVPADLRGPLNLTYWNNNSGGNGTFNVFSNPIELNAGQVARKELVFIFVGRRDALLDVIAKESDYNFVLEINDLISGKSVEILIPGDYRG